MEAFEAKSREIRQRIFREHSEAHGAPHGETVKLISREGHTRFSRSLQLLCSVSSKPANVKFDDRAELGSDFFF